jgi:hypothetical protein
MASPTQSRSGVQTGVRWKGRLLAVAAAVVAATVVYLLVSQVFGQDLRTRDEWRLDSRPQRRRSAARQRAGIAGSVGLLAVLEKFTANARRIWTIVAVVALVLSIGGRCPVPGSPPETGSR